MKLLLSIFAFFISQSVFASNSCLNISGKYSLPTDTAEEKTTLIYTQGGCDTLIVAGTHLSRAGGVILLPTVHYALDGSRPKSCQHGLANTCAAYSAYAQEIFKTMVNSTLADGGPHGVCEYTKSVLTKDAQGNLLETVADANCEDGYIGKLPAMIFHKEN